MLAQAVDIKSLYRNSEEYLNKEITVVGWIRTIRTSSHFGFIELNDGGFFRNLQIVFEENLPNFAEVGKLTISTALIVKGMLVPSPGAKQPFELKATEVFVEGTCPSDYPLQKKRHTMEYMRTIAHLRPSRLVRPSSPFSSAMHWRNAVLYKRMEGVLTVAF